jgi:hypothetical protein
MRMLGILPGVQMQLTCFVWNSTVYYDNGVYKKKKPFPSTGQVYLVYNTYSFRNDEKTFLLRNVFVVLHGPQ